MFWDPYFGWDTHMIRSCLFGLSALCVLASFVATTEGLGWTYPYTSSFLGSVAHHLVLDRHYFLYDRCVLLLENSIR